MEYSIAGYMERRRARRINEATRKGDNISDTESEPCSKKNSVTAAPFISTSKGIFLTFGPRHIKNLFN